MHKERPRHEQIDVVEVLPLVGDGPGFEARGRERMSGRAHAQRIEHQCLVIALPTIVQEAALRLPAQGHGVVVVLGPVPIHALVKRLGQSPQFALSRVVGIEVGGGGQHANDQQGSVDGRQL